MRSFLFCAALALVGCDDHEAHPPACEALHDACGAFHEGSGPGYDCHELSGTNDEAQCAAQMAMCVEVCSRDMSVAVDMSQRD